jgi:hypothetical protein
MTELLRRARGRDTKRHWALGGVAVLLLSASGCKRKEEPPPAASVPLGEAQEAPPPAPPPGPPPRCVPPKDAPTFAIRGRAKASTEAEAGIDLPYAVEIGTAVPTASGFAMGALRYDDGVPHALVALSDAEGARSQLIELGRVHGLADPPQVAARGDQVFAAVVDSDAAGPTLRLARLDAHVPEQAAASLTWCAETQQGRDDSSAFSLAVLPGDKASGLLVWDEYDQKAERGVLRSISWSGDDCGKTTPPRVLSPANIDAEAPNVVARPGGYWLAWLSPNHPAKVGGAVKAGKESADASAPKPAPKAEDESVVDILPQGLHLMPLDANGAPAGEPRRLTGPGAHVVVFDLAASSDGGALLAWHDDPTAPGSEGRALSVALVGPDGSVTQHRVEDERLAAGAPTLVSDAKGASWLAAAAADSEVLLGVVSRSGVAELEAEARLASRQLLTAWDGRFLYVEPRGLDATLGVLRCAPRAR